MSPMSTPPHSIVLPELHGSLPVRPALLNATPTATSSLSIDDALSISVDDDIGDDAEATASQEASVSSHRDERQIGLDTERSFVLYPVGEAFS